MHPLEMDVLVAMRQEQLRRLAVRPSRGGTRATDATLTAPAGRVCGYPFGRPQAAAVSR